MKRFLVTEKVGNYIEVDVDENHPDYPALLAEYGNDLKAMLFDIHYHVFNSYGVRQNVCSIVKEDEESLGKEYEEIAIPTEPQAENDKAEQFPQPKTVEEAVDQLVPQFDGIEKAIDLSLGVEKFVAFCQSQLSGGIGMKIRNQYGLWQESELFFTLRAASGFDHPDDQTGFLLRKVFTKLMEKGGEQ